MRATKNKLKDSLYYIQDKIKLSTDVWVIIPACNEEKRISNVLIKLKKIIKNFVVVDDGSKDKTKIIAKKEGAIVLKHIINMGKGAALKTGCDYAYSQGAKIIVVMDADGQHLPEDIPRMVSTLIENKLDIVFGGRKSNKRMPGLFKLGNSGLSWVTNKLYNVNIQDTQSGFRAFTSEAYRKIRWKSQDYSMESEMIANVGKKHLKYKEIPIQTIYLDKYKGTTIFNGLKIGFETLMWKFTKK